MNCSPIRKELIKKKLTDLQDEVSSLKQDFRNNRKSVDEYSFRFHDELSTLRGKKRNIHNLILGVLAANIQSREPSRRYLSELKPLLRQLNAVEADFQALLTSLNTKDPLEHADSAIKGSYI
nr:hypothetical protein HmN_000944800 [Hymenolepis microstoma]